MVGSKCKEKDCCKRATFNYINMSRAYCSSHKKDDMINLNKRICITENCGRYAVFNYKNEKKGIYCNKCKKDNMVNLQVESCLTDGCFISASFNHPNETKGIYCNNCKKEGMINVTSKKCISKDCKTIRLFNLPDQKSPLYCAKHKTSDMINVIHINRLCIYDNCNTTSYFNLPGEKKGLYCLNHKKDNMINVIDKKCLYENCRKKPRFNLEGKKSGLWCSLHKTIDMINVIDPRCKSPFCYVMTTKKYKGYCLSCFIHLFPDEPNSRNYKTKEKHITDHIKEKLPNLDWIVDRKVYDGCSRRRPDLFLDLGYQVLVVEIDENQHIDYDCSCENKRLMEISQDINHRPLIFIRFNPDKYTKGETKITSCWEMNSKGICIIKPLKKKEWNERLTNLETQIRYWINPENKTDKTIEVIQLYYDQ